MSGVYMMRKLRNQLDLHTFLGLFNKLMRKIFLLHYLVFTSLHENL
jgi:hypothetical protein